MKIPHLDTIKKPADNNYIIQGSFGDILFFKSEDLYIMIRRGEHILINPEWIAQYTPYLARMIDKPSFATIPLAPEEMIKTIIHAYCNKVPRFFTPRYDIHVKAVHSVFLAGNKSIFLLVNHHKITINISADFRINIQAPEIYSSHGDDWTSLVHIMQTLRWRLNTVSTVLERIINLEDMEWFIVNLINHYDDILASVEEINSALSLSISLSDWDSTTSSADEVEILL